MYSLWYTMLTPTSSTAMRPGAYKRMILTKSVDVAIGSGRGEVDGGEEREAWMAEIVRMKQTSDGWKVMLDKRC